MKSVLILFLLLITSGSLLFGQQSKIDSLIDLIPNTTSDTAKVNLLNHICFEMVGTNNKSALEYGNLARELSEKINYKKGLAQTHYNIGSVYKDLGDYNTCLKNYLISLEIREKLDDRKELAASLTNVGIVYKDMNSFSKSLEYLNRALDINVKSHDMNGTANTENGLGSLYWKYKNYDLALIHYMKALDIRELLGVKKDIAASLNNLGMVNKDYANYSLALDYYQKAKIISESIKDKKNVAYTLNLIGSAYWDMKMYGESIEHYLESLKIREELGNQKDIASTYNNIGNVYKNINNFQKALEYYKKALNLRKELADDNYTAYTLNDIGSIYWKLKSYKTALQYYQESLVIRRNLNDKLGIANSFKNIGIVYKEMKNYPVALESYKKALNIFENTNDKKNTANVLSYFGNIYSEQANYKEAQDYYTRAYNISKSAGYKEGMAAALTSLGETTAKTGKRAEAINFFNQAIDLALEIHSNEILARIYDTLDDLFAELSDYKNSWKFHKLLSEVKEELNREEGSKKIADITLNYLTEKNDKIINQKKIELLKKQTQLDKELYLRNFFIIVSIIILIILSLLYNQFRLKKRSNELLSKQKDEIEKQAKLLEFANNQLQVKNTQITDSISYAKLIQDAILPSEKKIRQYIPDSFIFFKPKDIVSGDFYWLYQEGKKTFFAVIDCTGHGVPGGFMSMIGYTLLNDIVKDKKTFEVAKILEKLNVGVMITLNQGESKQDDGMDLSICCIDRETKNLTIASANQTAIVIQENEIHSIKGDIYSIGGIFSTRRKVDFTTHTFDLQKNTILYMFSDGFPDQTGEEKNNKYGTVNLEQKLVENKNLPMKEQMEKLSLSFNNWKGCKRQIDDVLVTGIRISSD